MTILSKTGQSWKIWIMFAALLLSQASIIYGQMNLDTLPKDFYFLFVAGGAISTFMVFIAACVSIKCPSCGLKWFWSAVSGQESKKWLFWLLSLKSCPRCGEPKDG